MRTLIKNGNIVTTSQTYKADLLIENEIIKAIGDFSNETADEIIDATEKYVIPGAIDAHTHMNLKQSERFTSVDSFYTGGVAAACGGTTTIIDHIAFSAPGSNLHTSINHYYELAKDCAIDYAFHGVIQHINDDIINEMEGLVLNEGITSFKAYSTYGYPISDDGFLRILTSMKKTGGVLTVHCENHGITNYLKDDFVKNGKLAAKYHPLSRPNYTESETVGRLIQISELAGDSNLYIVHTSAKESLEQVRLARKKGIKNLKVETCPQYLFLTDDVYDKEDKESLKYIMAPPLRKKEDNVALINAIKDNTIDVVATDHCPFMLEQKLEGIGDFSKAPGGVAGVEERVMLMFTNMVSTGQITENEFVKIMCENPAKIFGMYPKKGTLTIGSDADIVIINPNNKSKIKRENLHSNCDYSIYEGFDVSCSIDNVFLRGKMIVKDGGFVGEKGYGKFIKRKPLI